MTCRRCQGCMTHDHFLDLQESGGEWWLQGWRCINCGYVFDPVLEKTVRAWMAAKWPFRKVAFPGRDMPMSVWNALPNRSLS